MPGGDIPEQRVERRAGRADQALGVARRREAVDQRDDYVVGGDQQVIGLDEGVLARGRVGRFVHGIDLRVVVFAAVAVVVAEVPVIGLRRDLGAGPAVEV